MCNIRPLISFEQYRMDSRNSNLIKEHIRYLWSLSQDHSFSDTDKAVPSVALNGIFWRAMFQASSSHVYNYGIMAISEVIHLANADFFLLYYIFLLLVVSGILVLINFSFYLHHANIAWLFNEENGFDIYTLLLSPFFLHLL